MIRLRQPLGGEMHLLKQLIAWHLVADFTHAAQLFPTTYLGQPSRSSRSSSHNNVLDTGSLGKFWLGMELFHMIRWHVTGCWRSYFQRTSKGPPKDLARIAARNERSVCLCFDDSQRPTQNCCQSYKALSFVKVGQPPPPPCDALIHDFWR